MIRGIFFDFDGVLFDMEPLHYAAWLKALDHIGYQDPSFTLEGAIGISDWILAEEFLAKSDARIPVDDLLQHKHNAYRSLVKSYDFDNREVKETLEKLRPHFDLFAIVSSSTKIDIEAILHRNDLRDYFSFIVSAESTPHHKPNPDPYLKALQIAGYNPSEAIAIEDSEVGLMATREANLKAVWINRYGWEKDPFFASFPSCTSLSGLPSLLLP